jgi:hypothetical protein
MQLIENIINSITIEEAFQRVRENLGCVVADRTEDWMA